MRDSFGARALRRCLTVPVIGVGWVLATLSLPVLLLIGVVTDVLIPVRRATHSTTRFMFFVCAFFWVELVGLTLLCGTFLVTLGSLARRAELTWKTQRLYTAMHMFSVRSIFKVRFDVTGGELASTGPFIVLMRHASIIDTLLPGILIANQHKIRLRYVLKRELLFEPCLDIAGHWVPNHFVSRDGTDTERELASIAALKEGLGARDGVMIYPEGTRFSVAKRDAMRAKNPAAATLSHLLPIRPGGALTLLSAGVPCDVLIVGHVGLEGFTQVSDVINGALVGKTIQVRVWREAASSIPHGSDAQLAWLNARWQALDAWLEAHERQERGASNRPAPISQ